MAKVKSSASSLSAYRRLLGLNKNTDVTIRDKFLRDIGMSELIDSYTEPVTAISQRQQNNAHYNREDVQTVRHGLLGGFRDVASGIYGLIEPHETAVKAQADKASADRASADARQSLDNFFESHNSPKNKSNDSSAEESVNVSGYPVSASKRHKNPLDFKSSFSDSQNSSSHNSLGDKFNFPKVYNELIKNIALSNIDNRLIEWARTNPQKFEHFEKALSDTYSRDVIESLSLNERNSLMTGFIVKTGSVEEKKLFSELGGKAFGDN